MKNVNVDDLIGSELDWAVAKAIKAEKIDCDHDAQVLSVDVGHTKYCNWEVSSDWEQCGPLVEQLVRSGFEISPSHTGFRVSNYTDEGLPYNGWESPEIRASGRSVMQAVCRAIVEAAFGDTVDVPSILW